MWFQREKPQVPEPFFAWSDADYSVGVGGVDQDHRRLAELLTEVHDALLDRRDRMAAQRSLEQLIHETRAHFNREEDLLRQAGYGDLESHARDHLALLEQAQDLLRKFQAGTLSGLALPLFLKAWLISHIQGADRKYAATLRRKGIR